MHGGPFDAASIGGAPSKGVYALSRGACRVIGPPFTAGSAALESLILSNPVYGVSLSRLEPFTAERSARRSHREATGLKPGRARNPVNGVLKNTGSNFCPPPRPSMAGLIPPTAEKGRKRPSGEFIPLHRKPSSRTRQSSGRYQTARMRAVRIHFHFVGRGWLARNPGEGGGERT